MRILFVFWGIMMFNLVSAQKDDTHVSPIDYKGPCRSSFERIPLAGGNNADNVQRYITQHFENLKGDKTGLAFDYVTESLSGKHYAFTQTYKGVKVYQSDVKVNVSKADEIYAVFDNSFNTADWDIDVSRATENSVIARNPQTDRFVLAEKIVEDRFYEVLKAGDEIIYKRDMRTFFAPDSLVSGKVFNPDPLTTAGQVYGGMYVDNGDTNAPWLDAQLRTVSFIATFTGSQFFLQNQYLRIVDVDAPNIDPVFSTTPQFYYNRSQSGFEDVNAFYHISTYSNYVRALGYNLPDKLLHLDTHGSIDDQSFYLSSTSPNRINFGIGRIDDAEDADVLIHEFGHFLSYNAAPNTNNGFERTSLDEAFGDYLAASYSKAINSFNAYKVFNWDGAGPYSGDPQLWSGRIVNTGKTYEDKDPNNMYRNAPIWSTALMNIHDDIGRGVTDTLIIETHYNYSSNMSMEEAARLMVIVDSVIFNGAHYCPIYKRMFERKLMPYYAGNPCGVSSVNDAPKLKAQFYGRSNGFTVFSEETDKIQMVLMNIQGQQVTPPVDINHTIYNYSHVNLTNGMYIVVLRTPTASATFKWSKAE